MLDYRSVFSPKHRGEKACHTGRSTPIIAKDTLSSGPFGDFFFEKNLPLPPPGDSLGIIKFEVENWSAQFFL